MTTTVGEHDRRREPAPVVALIGVALVAIALALAAAPHAVAQEPDALGDLDAGREVFATTCAICHGAAAQGRGSAPSLIEVYDHHTIRAAAAPRP